jgi:hypothetical protein
MAIFSSIGSVVEYFLAYCAFLGVTAVLTGIFCSTLAGLTLKGKSDVDQQAVGGFFSGYVIGLIVAFFLIGYFIFTMTFYTTFMSMLGIWAILVVASLFVSFLSQRLYGR